MPTPVLVRHTGAVLARRSFYYVGFCDIQAKYYPYDAHTCFLQGIAYDIHVILKLRYKHIIHNNAIGYFHTRWWLSYTKLELEGPIKNENEFIDNIVRFYFVFKNKNPQKETL